ncbi:hypothetical protein D3C84_1226260 [compost metagenome]
MALAVIVAPENLGEKPADGLGITIFNKHFTLNDIWGRPEAVRVHICEIFRDPELFA